MEEKSSASKEKIPFFINAKLTLLHWFYNPGFRFLLLFLLLFRFFYFSPFFISPLKLSSILYGIAMILIYYFILIVWVEALAEIFINSSLNKKQRNFLSKGYALLILPLSAYLVYNVFSVNLANINVLTVSFGIISSFLIFFTLIKNVRYSFLLTWVLSGVFFFNLSPSFEIIFWSTGLSNFLILLLIRYSELNPHLWVQNDILEKNKIRKENLLIKSKEKMVRSKEIYFVNDEPYFLKGNGLFNKFDKKILDKRILSEVIYLKGVKNKIYQAKLNNFFEIIPILKQNEIPFNKDRIYRFNLLMNSLKFIDIALFSIITILLFNPKVNRRLAKLTLDNYEKFITVDKSLDKKELWKSDLDMDITGEEEREYQFIINQITSYFYEVPSKTFLPDLKKVIKKYAEKLNMHEKTIKERIKYAEKTYGKNSKFNWSYLRLNRGIEKSKKYLVSISGAIK